MTTKQDDAAVSTDLMIEGMDTALNSLEELERMIDLKRKSNDTMAKMVEELSEKE